MGTPIDPIGWAIIGATALGTGAKIYSAQAEAAHRQGLYEAEARARELEAKQADLQARQISAQRLQELNANLGAIIAMRAGKNLLGDSPTSAAIIRSFTHESLGARANEILDARLRALSARNAMWAAQQNARFAQQQGVLDTIGAIADGVGSMAGFLHNPSAPAAKKKQTTMAFPRTNTKKGR